MRSRLRKMSSKNSCNSSIALQQIISKHWRRKIAEQRNMLQTQITQANIDISNRERELVKARKAAERAKPELEITKRALEERARKHEEEERMHQRIQMRSRQKTRCPINFIRSDELEDESPPRPPHRQVDMGYLLNAAGAAFNIESDEFDEFDERALPPTHLNTT